MVVLNRIYTRTGDDGSTALGTGERRSKADLRVSAYGTVDELNATIGLARLHTRDHADLDAVLGRIQNELFDLGADLATPEGPADTSPRGALRIVASQVDRLEADIDRFNARLTPLRSFVLPGGSALAANLHLARTICRRAEREIVALADREPVNGAALHYVNRLSDFLFVAGRIANEDGAGDVLWVPGATR
ncbi:cob(I)yrinic acid a,c-diamide adenosyltransferase [Segnochrobactrum spirostomi]|uniref:Corrinoid adenosyltransferase n=1 Tax=Segnochrobactrum spirostomi TaxID=2608987 RepID=A0A6A7Y2M5_9HYPH|nr:cob(I)yrinic acid a,c-diamide adenosyltransferase [Segnochrobactrum spirostomi]MQT12996.1 cob(I)yrinic acid a,c-diamide adenosyltransferase [Segnochrobactrum spirostomi]